MNFFSRIDETEWKCISCDWSMTTEEVHKKFKELENEVKALDLVLFW